MSSLRHKKEFMAEHLEDFLEDCRQMNDSKPKKTNKQRLKLYLPPKRVLTRNRKQVHDITNDK